MSSLFIKLLAIGNDEKKIEEVGKVSLNKISADLLIMHLLIHIVSVFCCLFNTLKRIH